MESKEKFLLREYVRRLLREDGEGGGGGGAVGDGWDFSGMAGPWGGGGGGGGGSGGEAYQAASELFAGFINTWETGKMAIKSIASSVGHVLKLSTRVVIQSVFPNAQNRYAELAMKEKQRQEKINHEYAAVYSKIIDEMRRNDDFQVSAFFFDPSKWFDTVIQNPTAYITVAFAKNAKPSFLGILNHFTGGHFEERLRNEHPELRDDRNWRRYRQHMEHGRQDNERVVKPNAKQRRGIEQAMAQESFVPGGRLVIEEAQEEQLDFAKLDKSAKKILEEYVQSQPKKVEAAKANVQKLVPESSQIEEASAEQQKSLVLSQMFKDAMAVNAAESLEDIVKTGLLTSNDAAKIKQDLQKAASKTNEDVATKQQPPAQEQKPQTSQNPQKPQQDSSQVIQDAEKMVVVEAKLAIIGGLSELVSRYKKFLESNNDMATDLRSARLKHADAVLKKFDGIIKNLESLAKGH
jgi:hypothetical protein